MLLYNQVHTLIHSLYFDITDDDGERLHRNISHVIGVKMAEFFNMVIADDAGEIDFYMWLAATGKSKFVYQAYLDCTTNRPSNHRYIAFVDDDEDGFPETHYYPINMPPYSDFAGWFDDYDDYPEYDDFEDYQEYNDYD